MWFDFDILFIKKIPEYLFKNKDFYYFSYCETIPTGLLLSKPNTLYLNLIYNEALYILQNLSKSNYQLVGPDLWKKHIYCKNLENTECLDNKLVYAYDWLTYNKLYVSTEDLFIEESFACHWYNGGNYTKQFINIINDQYGGKFDNNRSVMEKYIVNIINI